MILLDATNETLEITTTAAVSADYHVAYADHTTTTFTPGSAEGNISTATTTTAVAAPAASTQRQIKLVSIRNRHASSSQTVTVIKDVAATEYHLTPAVALLAGEHLLYVDGVGWTHYTADGLVKASTSVTVASDAIWDAKGDLAVGTGANTAAVLTVGANDSIPMADSNEATGLKWVGSATPEAVGTASAEGTGDTFSRGNHVHAHEAAHINHDTTWAAKGDLIQGTANDTAAVLTVGANNKALIAASGETTGALWKSVMPPILLRPGANEPPAASYATDDLRNGHPVLDFDGAADEEAVWTCELPASYAGGGLTVNTWWSLESVTTGSFRVQAAIERIDESGLDVDADSFAAFQSAGGSAPATNGMEVNVPVVFTDGAQMDSVVAGEMFRVKIRRDADGTSGTDDISGEDANLYLVQIVET